MDFFFFALLLNNKGVRRKVKKVICCFHYFDLYTFKVFLNVCCFFPSSLKEEHFLEKGHKLLASGLEATQPFLTLEKTYMTAIVATKHSEVLSGIDRKYRFFPT